jgi:UDP-glucose 4-epimerase
VTGGAGFIGCHLVKSLVDNGWTVTVVDDMSAGKLENLSDKVSFRTVLPPMIEQFLSQVKLEKEQVLVITGDFVDSNVVHHIHNHGYTHVFHLAANPRVEYSVQYPATTTDVNVKKTVELMTVCKNAKVKKFVFASSSAVYGDPAHLPTPESDAPAKTQSPYGLQKWVIEEFMELYSRLYDFKGVAARFANVYGPNSDGSSPYSTAIGAWCNKLKLGQPLRSDGDGEQSRDMIYVEDVVTALRLCAEKDTKDNFHAFNVGTGIAYTNNEILQKIKRIAGNFDVLHAPARTGDVRHTLLDVTGISNTVGWEAKVYIDDGLRRTLEWWGIPAADI